MNIKIFCHCSFFPFWSGQGLISTSVNRSTKNIWKENVLAKNKSHSARFEILSAVLVSLNSSIT